jgi:hypothetical protein
VRRQITELNAEAARADSEDNMLASRAIIFATVFFTGFHDDEYWRRTGR